MICTHFKGEAVESYIYIYIDIYIYIYKHCMKYVRALAGNGLG